MLPRSGQESGVDCPHRRDGGGAALDDEFVGLGQIGAAGQEILAAVVGGEHLDAATGCREIADDDRPLAEDGRFIARPDDVALRDARSPQGVTRSQRVHVVVSFRAASRR